MNRSRHSKFWRQIELAEFSYGVQVCQGQVIDSDQDTVEGFPGHARAGHVMLIGRIFFGHVLSLDSKIAEMGKPNHAAVFE